MIIYDSEQDTLNHIKLVQSFLEEVVNILKERQNLHDLSKLQDIEKGYFDEYTPKLKGLTYGSEEYKSILEEMKPALAHHYKVNSHHPEHYENGINGMTLFDLIEMFCDWKAATTRHSNGSLSKSIRINKDRFNIGNQLVDIFENTKTFLGW